MAEPMNSDTASDRFPWSTVASDGVKFDAFNVTDVQRILDQEVEGWAWLSAPGDGQFSLVIELRNRLSRAKSTLAASDFHDGKLIEILEAVEEYLRFSPPLHHRSSFHSVLRTLGKEYPEAARVALGLYLKEGGRLRRFSTSTDPIDTAIGVSQWMEWRRTVGHSSSAQAAHAEILQSQVKEAQEFRNETAQIASDAQKHRAAILEVHQKCESVVEDKLAQWEKEVSAFKERASSEWQRITTAYEEQLALKAPANYWQKKAEIHKETSKTFAIWTAVFGALGGIAVGILIFWLLQSNNIQSAGPAILAAVVFLWGLRTLVRMTMSHVHLHFDALERRTMVVSYIALSRKREVSPEERTALAAAIFRSTGDGIVKDEAPPTPLWELLKGGR